MDLLENQIINQNYSNSDNNIEQMFGEEIVSIHNINRIILTSGVIRKFIEQRDTFNNRINLLINGHIPAENMS